VAGEQVDATLTIRSVELAHSPVVIIEEQIREGFRQTQPTRNDKRPAPGVSAAGELADAALSIGAVELGQSAAAIIEEQRVVVISSCKMTGNDVRPAPGVGAAGEQVDVGLKICAVELCCSCIAVIEEQIRISTLYKAGKDLCPACPPARVAFEQDYVALANCVVEFALSGISIVKK